VSAFRKPLTDWLRNWNVRLRRQLHLA